MGKFDGILICSDIDGTLTMTNKSIPKENCDAINYFMENGGMFSVATGRFPNYFEKFSKYLIPNAPTLGLNGTVIYDQNLKKVIYDCPFDGDAPSMIFDILEKYKELSSGLAHCKGEFSYFIERQDIGYLLRKMDMRGEVISPLEIAREKIYKKSDLLEIFEKDKALVYKIAVRVPEKDSDCIFSALKEDFCNFNVFRSWINGIEIQSSRADKGKSALRLRNLLKGIKLLVCVGDYENDVDMIRAADIGYAVGNACDAAKDVADRITVNCEQFAIKAIVKDLENIDYLGQ